jgi:hypothetical protein
MTSTTNKGILQPANASFTGTWDVPINADFTLIDTALGSTVVLNPTSLSGVVALTAPVFNGSGSLTSSGNYVQPAITVGANLTTAATLTANVNYQFPSGINGVWTVYNNTTGPYSITFSCAGGGQSVAIPQGYALSITCDGGVSGIGIRQSTNSALIFAVSTFRLLGATSGYVGFQGPAVGSNFVWTLPSADGTSGQFLQTNGSGGLSFATVTAGVSSFQTSLSGLTPSTTTTGAITLAGTLGVASGGTGATTLSGYVFGNGTGAFTASSTIAGTAITGNISGNAANVTGTVVVGNGGTGATTLSGVVYGNGTSAFTAASAAQIVAAIGATAVANATTAAACSGNSATASATGSAVTFNNGGAGAASGTTFNGSGAVTVSYNTVGAPSATGSGASGNWGINVTGSSASCTGNAANVTGTVVVGNGGTGVTTLSGLAYGNGTSAFTAASAAQVVAIIGATAVTNATTATTANALATGNNYQVNSLGVGTAASGTTGQVAHAGDAYYTSAVSPTSTLSIGFRGIPQNSQAGGYTCVLADAGQHILCNGAVTITIPANASVAYPIGTTLTFVNNQAASSSIAITTDTMYLANSTNTSTRTLAQNGVATAVKITSTSWIISGMGLS